MYQLLETVEFVVYVVAMTLQRLRDLVTIANNGWKTTNP